MSGGSLMSGDGHQAGGAGRPQFECPARLCPGSGTSVELLALGLSSPVGLLSNGREHRPHKLRQELADAIEGPEEHQPPECGEHPECNFIAVAADDLKVPIDLPGT